MGVSVVPFIQLRWLPPWLVLGRSWVACSVRRVAAGILCALLAPTAVAC
jgi:hypothetical protein